MQTITEQEKEALGTTTVDTAMAVEILERALPDDQEGVAPILPDIVGEAFVLRYLARGKAAESTAAIQRAFELNPSMTSAVLVRCVQDFAPSYLAGPSDVNSVKQLCHGVFVLTSQCRWARVLCHPQIVEHQAHVAG